MKRVLNVAMGLGLVMATMGWADVTNMGGSRNPDGSWNGLASLETVPVGNPGNPGELSGAGAAGGNSYYGPDRICGAVDYEYRIGKYEVTAGQYCEFLNAVAGTDTYGLYTTDMASYPEFMGCNIRRSGSPGSYTYSVASAWANRPVNHVNWADAARFANWLHNGQPTALQGTSTTEDGVYDLSRTHQCYNADGTIRDRPGLNSALLALTRKENWTWAVTSEDEWYKAAYYKGGSTNAGYFDFPTCSDIAPSNDWSNPYPDPGNNANYSNDGYTIGPAYYRTEVGDFENSESPYGTFDQGGNVWEWNESNFTSYERGLRGGSYYSHNYDGGLPASLRYKLSPAVKRYDIGFRVVQVPEPVSMMILVLGGIGILARRRGRAKTTY